MSQTAIPIEFEKYLQDKISTGQGPEMNEMIFAYLPELDLSQEIDRTTGLPDTAYWVHQQDIDQVGKLGDNALVYSVVIPGSVAEFTFNAIYLRDKNTVNSCGMVVHKADETKEAGMASTKSLVQQYTGAAHIAGVTVDASTWQIDYQARLSGIENDIRLAWVDYYGHTAFINGYDVIQQADKTKFKITAGTAYVGGLRAVLEHDVIQTLSTLPTALYLDVVRQGTVLSVWSNQVSVVASQTTRSDYVDGNNQQHYVAKIADIAADGSVTIDRPLSEMEAHLQAENPHPQYIDANELQVALENLNSLSLSSMVGWVLPFHMEGSLDGWLDLKGGEYSRTTDAKLWAYAQATGLLISQVTKDAEPETYAMYFGTGNENSTFTLPNHHLGHFVRGTPNDGAHGETLEDQNKAHTHTAPGTAYFFGKLAAGPGVDFTNATVTTSSSGGDEARPKTAHLSYKIHRGWK